MTRTQLKEFLEVSFQDFELGDSIQILDTYIYVEVEIRGTDQKLRLPFDFDIFNAKIELNGLDSCMFELEKNLYVELLKMVNYC